MIEILKIYRQHLNSINFLSFITRTLHPTFTVAAVPFSLSLVATGKEKCEFEWVNGARYYENFWISTRTHGSDTFSKNKKRSHTSTKSLTLADAVYDSARNYFTIYLPTKRILVATAVKAASAHIIVKICTHLSNMVGSHRHMSNADSIYYEFIVYKSNYFIIFSLLLHRQIPLWRWVQVSRT